VIFSSYPFALFFLPAVLASVWLLRRAGQEWILALLNLSSLLFYAWWDWRSIWIILVSIAANFAFGRYLDGSRDRGQRILLTFGIAFNLAFLGWFKYTNFAIANLAALTGSAISPVDVVLPLGVSFFTFTQIAYLVDAYRGDAEEHDLRHYFLFVTFFPHLIAGPIVHHKQMMPQFVRGLGGRLNSNHLAHGLAIFVLGMAKKVLIADPVGRYASPVFDAAAAGVAIPMLEAWCGVLAYTLQIYFDFSAYSDMAVGLALMFGIRFPVNFLSPYKAVDLVDFWRRWHISLSGFLRDYLYIPLGGNRAGGLRRYANVFVVMLLGGLWHGASWNFVVWGGLHGVGIVGNQVWRARRIERGENPQADGSFRRWQGRLLTFGFVMLGWIFFRASDLPTAMNLLGGMVGANGVVLPPTYADHLGALAEVVRAWGWRFETGYLFVGVKQIGLLMVLLAIVWGLPNVMEWAGYQEAERRDRLAEDCPAWLRWKPSARWALALSAVAIASLYFMSRTGEFLYFQF
jgi:alginate O-acetyltransferase complex protein AlgI